MCNTSEQEDLYGHSTLKSRMRRLRAGVVIFHLDWNMKLHFGIMEDLVYSCSDVGCLRGNDCEGFVFGVGGVTEGPSFMHAPDTIRRFGDLNKLPGKIAKRFSDLPGTITGGSCTSTTH